MECPKCRLINPPNALQCDCGYVLTPPATEKGKSDRFDAVTVAAPRPVITYSLIAMNTAVFIAMVLSDVSSLMDPAIPTLLRWGGNFAPLVAAGQWWRILTSAFVHIGVIHVAMNMAILFSIGALLEKLYGRLGFALLYFLSGIGGNLIGLAVHPMTVSAGASGAIFGLYGGLFGFLLIDRKFLPSTEVKSLAKGGAIFLACTFIYSLRSGVDLAAHAGGLVSGLLFGAALALPMPVDPRLRLRRNVMVACAGAILALPALRLSTEKPSLMYHAAEMYGKGEEVAKDDATAVRLYRKAAQAGDADAAYALGLRYSKGRGVERNYSLAMQWYRKAAENGDAFAMNNIGAMYEKGEGIPRDYGQALLWYQKAADVGDALAMKNIAALYGYGRGVTEDPGQAMQWYRKSGEAGNSDAMYMVGLRCVAGQDYKEAIRWYQKAADAGNSFAMNNIGVLYENGQGVPKDLGEAMQWYRKATDDGDSVAMSNIARLFEKGLGVSADRNKAIEWYRKAASAGNKNAQSNLSRLGATP